ncbi:hypothetical protein [Arthrobacter sp. SD76]|uniref:hypothetical protein n=1 Tax=Arthrobacter sp. SD76 TaxID=3415007 RepID=UPI003C70DA19
MWRSTRASPGFTTDTEFSAESTMYREPSGPTASQCDPPDTLIARVALSDPGATIPISPLPDPPDWDTYSVPSGVTASDVGKWAAMVRDGLVSPGG